MVAMSKNRWVNTRFWGDNYIIDLDPSEKLLFLYCLTNDNTSLCGAYEVSLKTICLETGFDKEMVLKILQRFEKDNKIAFQNGYIIVKNYQKWQSDNPSVRAGVDREIKQLPEPVRDRLYTAWVQSDNTLLNLTLLNLRTGNTPYPLEGEEPEPKKELQLSPESKELWDYWEENLAPITRNQIFNRNSLLAMRRQHGVEKVKQLIRVAVAAHSEVYTPKNLKVSSPKQLEQQWDSLVLWAKGKSSQQPKSFSTKRTL